ncbi:MAG: hypothetical protein F4022_15475, partial [Gemmatimonadetes bacterium]|nr:hypothetical protein [Gemmatimonadota bacterium]
LSTAYLMSIRVVVSQLCIEEEGDFDAAVVVIGERPYAEGLGDIREAGPVRPGTNHLPAGPGVLEPYGDTLELAVLHPEDLRAIRGLSERGIPVVAVLVSGRPLVVDDELAASAAFVVAWMQGTEGGGVADVLFGDWHFVGRLPMGWMGRARCSSRVDSGCGQGLRVAPARPGPARPDMDSDHAGQVRRRHGQ